MFLSSFVAVDLKTVLFAKKLVPKITLDELKNSYMTKEIKVLSVWIFEKRTEESEVIFQVPYLVYIA